MAAQQDSAQRARESAPDHCFREDNCAEHPGYDGAGCCCCGRPADEHTDCDCEDA